MDERRERMGELAEPNPDYGSLVLLACLESEARSVRRQQKEEKDAKSF